MSPGSPGSHTQTGGPVIALRSKSFQSTHSRSSSRRPDRGPGRADRDRDRTGPRLSRAAGAETRLVWERPGCLCFFGWCAVFFVCVLVGVAFVCVSS